MTAPDRTLYILTWQGPVDGYVYGPSQVSSYDLDTGAPIATSEAMGTGADPVYSLAYDYQGSLWGVGSGRLVQIDPATLDVLSTPVLPSLSVGLRVPMGITFSNRFGYLWFPYLDRANEPESLTSCSVTSESITAVYEYGYFAPNRDGPYYGAAYGVPWWVQTPLAGSAPYAFTLGWSDYGYCILVRMKLCGVVNGIVPEWETVATIGPENYYYEPPAPNEEGELGWAWWWDYAGPVVTPAGVYVLSLPTGTLNLYDLGPLTSGTGGAPGSIPPPVATPLKTWPYSSQCQNFAIDSVNNVAYMVNVVTWLSDAGLGQSEIYALDLTTGDTTLFATIPCIFAAYEGNDEWTYPVYSSGPTVHIPLPSAPIVSCGTPWLRQFQRSDAYGVRQSQVAGSANSPLSVRNQSAGNSYT